MRHDNLITTSSRARQVGRVPTLALAQTLALALTLALSLTLNP